MLSNKKIGYTILLSAVLMLSVSSCSKDCEDSDEIDNKGLPGTSTSTSASKCENDVAIQHSLPNADDTTGCGSCVPDICVF
jgi:hypothetical protein